VLLQAAVHGASAQTESLRRVADVASMATQGALDQMAFDFFKTHVFKPRSASGWI
jgi:hypothetical protein